MLRAFRSLLVLLAICSAPAVARAGDPVDLLLVFAADVSRSIDQPKFQLQREGYAAAIADKRVLEAITAGRHKRIAIAFVEWSGVSSQKLLIDWTVIDGPDAAKKFGGPDNHPARSLQHVNAARNENGADLYGVEVLRT